MYHWRESQCSRTASHRSCVSSGFAATLGIKHYDAELGPDRHPDFGSESGQSTDFAIDREQKGWDLNIGLGHGWTEADTRIAKLIVGLPF